MPQSILSDISIGDSSYDLTPIDTSYISSSPDFTDELREEMRETKLYFEFLIYKGLISEKEFEQFKKNISTLKSID